MSINLSKGSSVNLTKSVPGLNRVRVGLGWEKVNPAPFDLDASAFVCSVASGNPKLLSDEHFVFFNNKSTPNGSVKHSGDNLTGDGDGDDETIIVNLTTLESNVDEISFIVTIHDAVARGQSFGKLRDSYIKVYNDETGVLLCEYDLDASFSSETAVQFGSLIKTNGQWEFKAVGAGYNLSLGDFVAGYQG